MEHTSDIGVKVVNDDYLIKREISVIIGAFWFVYISNSGEGWGKDEVRLGLGEKRDDRSSYDVMSIKEEMAKEKEGEGIREEVEINQSIIVQGMSSDMLR